MIDEKRNEEEPTRSEATVMIEGPDGKTEHTAATGNGPVNALDNALRKALPPVHALDRALRKALVQFFPKLKDVQLHDYKVRVLDGHEGTAGMVRVFIESGDGNDHWGTVGVSHNVVEASWQALVDSILYKLHKDRRPSSKKR